MAGVKAAFALTLQECSRATLLIRRHPCPRLGVSAGPTDAKEDPSGVSADPLPPSAESPPTGAADSSVQERPPSRLLTACAPGFRKPPDSTELGHAAAKSEVDWDEEPLDATPCPFPEPDMPQCGSSEIRYPTGSSNATTDADGEAAKNLALAGIRGQAGIARDIEDNLKALLLPLYFRLFPAAAKCAHPPLRLCMSSNDCLLQCISNVSIFI